MKKQIRRLVAAGLMTVLMASELSAISMPSVMAASTGKVNTSALNLRSGASTSTGIVGVLYKGTEVTIDGTSGNWYKVTVKVGGTTKKGYVHSDYITKDGGSTNTSVNGSGVVNVNGLNVRSGPSTSSSVIGSVNSGTKVTIKEKLGEWYKVSVKLGGVTKDGYMFAQYVTRTGGSNGSSNNGGNSGSDNSDTSVGGAEGTVNTAALNVRSGPGTSYTRIDCISKGTEVTILSEDGDWYKVKFGGKTGYVSARYITKKSGSSNGGGNSDGSDSNTSIKNKLGVVNVSALNLRAKATTNSSVVTCLYAGTQVTIESSTTGWYKVNTKVGGKSYSGYVASQYVTITGDAPSDGGSDNNGGDNSGNNGGDNSGNNGGDNSGNNGGSDNGNAGTEKKTGKVNTAVLNFRSGPSTSSSVIGSLRLGTSVTILSESGGWYNIEVLYNGRTVTGYVSAQYVEVTGNAGDENNSGSSGGDSEISGDFEEMIAAFPESYRASLRNLHKKYPEWVFKPVNTGLDWNTVIKEESVFRINTTQTSINANTNFADLSTASGAYDWSTDRFTVCDGSNWYSASSDLIKYYMDPRNFLDERYIFSFESLAYDKAHTKDGVQSILNGTFMKGSYTETDPSTGVKTTKSYADTFMEAGKIAGASPYYLAAKARLELGVNGSNSSSGTYYKKPGYYNFFNIGASDGADAVLNGLNFAAKNDPNFYLPWNTRYKSIVGGAKYIANYFINVGQNTSYTQKFNVVYKDKLYRNQYMTAVHGASSSASTVYNSYKSIGVLDSKFVFYIPVYNNMPSSPCARPAYAGNPNSYLKTLQLNSGNVALTPSFRYDKTEYSVIVGSNVSEITVSASPVSKYAKGVSGTGTYSLKQGQNKVTVTCTAGDGTTRTYTINVIRI